MEEIKLIQQKIFEDLTKKERKLLRREFNKEVKIRFKIFLWIGIGLLFPAIISGGFSIYYMLNIFFANVVVMQLYICAAIFIVGCVVSLFLTAQYHKKFRIWLMESKNIVTKTCEASKST